MIIGQLSYAILWDIAPNYVMTYNFMEEHTEINEMKTKFITILMTTVLVLTMFSVLQITAFADEKEDVPTEPKNGIPLVIIRVDESEEAIAAAEEASGTDPGNRKDYGTIAEMNGSEDHSVRCTGTVEIKVPEGYKGEYGSIIVPDGEVKLKYIRGRGNSTWSTDPELKKPYKIEYADKQDLFGMGKNKEWALMANAYDNTLVRNRVVSWLGERMGFAYTPQMVPVDVVMIGSESGGAELGSYCLSELVSVGKNRLDIDGAKLLAYYSNIQNEGDLYFTTKGGTDLKFEDPEEENEQVEAFINDLEDLIMSPEHIAGDGHEAVAEKMDMRSAADFWWIQEFVCNGDSYGSSSTYMYIDPDPTLKLFWGPLWDFDLTFSDREEEEDLGTKFGFNNTVSPWFDKLRTEDPEFIRILNERWNGSDDTEDPYAGLNELLNEVTVTGGELDRMKEELRASWNRDRDVWGRHHDWEEEKSDIDTYIEEMRTWIEKRRAWINDNLDKIGQVYHTVTYMADGNEVGTEIVRENDVASNSPEPPEKDGYLFECWQERETGGSIEWVSILKDTTFDAVYVREEDAVKPTGAYFFFDEDWAALDEKEYCDNAKVIVPEDAIVSNMIWTSSDESVGVVDRYGIVTLLSEGDTTITLTLYNGVSASYVLHVYDSGKVTPDKATSVVADPKSLTLKVGETKLLGYSILPESGVFDNFWVTYEADESGCVETDGRIITGVKPGKATVRICLNANNKTEEFTDLCTVTVVGSGTPVSIKGAKVDLSERSFTYNGRKQKPSIRKIKGLKLRPGKDYTARWSGSSSKNVGKYTVTITGRGKYTGTTKATYKIVPKGTSITRLTRAGRNVKVKWKKQPAKMSKSRITGYQIQISTSRKFTGNRKTVTVKGYKTVSKIVTKLKAGKKYYVRIRTYMTVKGEKCNSPWSKVKTVKTKNIF